jgi:hypothetical protein
MTDKIIDGLDDRFKKHFSTFRRISLDSSSSDQRVYMSDSTLRVINFDKIPNEYSRGKGWAGVPTSNDGLYISCDGRWFFVEFKNGSIDKSNIYRKLYDSLIMLLDWKIIKDIQFVRDNGHYVLVYNSDKHESIPNAENRNKTLEFVLNRANTEKKLYDIKKFEGYLFKTTHTYTEKEFKTKFVDIMELQEEETKDY